MTQTHAGEMPICTVLLRESADEPIASTVCLCIGYRDGICLKAHDAERVIAALQGALRELERRNLCGCDDEL